MSDVRTIETPILQALIRAAETEPVTVQSLLGASGIEHAILGAGVDPGRKRMVVVCDAAEPKAAAFMLADLQISFKAVQIVMVRIADDAIPVTDELSDMALGLGWIRPGPLDPASRTGVATTELSRYFFPAPDHLALALIDRWSFATIPQVVDQMVRASDLGHPFGPPELLNDYDSFTNLIQELQQMGLVTTANGQLTITESGHAVRATDQSQPREAVASKLLNRMKASLGFQPIWLPVIRGHAGGTGTL